MPEILGAKTGVYVSLARKTAGSFQLALSCRGVPTHVSSAALVTALFRIGDLDQC